MKYATNINLYLIIAVILIICGWILTPSDLGLGLFFGGFIVFIGRMVII